MGRGARRAWRRRAVALALPIPLLAGAGVILSGLGVLGAARVVVHLPRAAIFGVGQWLGVGDAAAARTAAGLTIAGWYVLLALVAQAVLLPRERAGRSLAWAGVGGAAVWGAVWAWA